VRPEIIVDRGCLLGEGPLWHSEEGALYWLDYLRGHLYRFDPSSGKHELIYQGPRVSGFTFQADGGLLLLLDGARVATWRDGVTRVLIDGLVGGEGMHFNDAVADPVGRVFTGTVPDDLSRLHEGVGTLVRIDTDARVTKLAEGIGISNGLGFSPACDRMYYTDTTARRIYVFDYDVISGNLANQRVFVETPPNAGVPDGLTVDREGCVWSARWDGWALYRYGPDGREDRRIPFPARKISSVSFGGPDLADLYVTSAGGDDRKEQGEAAGALFRLASGTQGMPEYRSRIGLG
jgi:D-xylonolactonase